MVIRTIRHMDTTAQDVDHIILTIQLMGTAHGVVLELHFLVDFYLADYYSKTNLLNKGDENNTSQKSSSS